MQEAAEGTGDAGRRLQRLGDWLLGREPRLRWRVSQQLFASVLTLGCLFIMHFATSLSAAPTGLVRLWMGLNLAAQGLVYVAIRSRWSERLKEPALTLPQILFALVSGAMAYPMSGPLAGMVLPIVLLVLAFGMFRLSAAVAMRLAWLALALLSLAMAVAYWVWPRGLDASLLIGQWLMALVTFPGMAFMTGRLSRMRHRLRQQREELNTALARIEELATRDALTGLFNRRHADGCLQQALRERQRQPRPLSLALIDLDHFKRINDSHGHAVGDAVLKAFAQAGQITLRDTDFLARWGGEEFLLLLPEDAAAPAVLARLQQAVRLCTLDVAGVPLNFSFSAGLVRWAPGDTPESLLERADRALYQAKAAGRDRVVQA